MCGVLTESFSSTTINMLLAHMYVDGSETSRSEREIHIAKPYAVSPQRFPSTAHYIALGHLHRPQSVGASHIRYSGAPLAFTFDEETCAKSLSLVELDADGRAEVSLIPITPKSAIVSMAFCGPS